MTNKHNSFINSLCDDIKTPCCKAPCPWRYIGAVVAISVVYSAVILTFVYGFREDILKQLENPFYIADVAVSILVGFFGLAVAFKSAIPGKVKKHHWVILFFMASLAACLALFSQCANTPEGYVLHGLDCFFHLGLLGLPPVLYAFYVLKKLAPTTPKRSSLYVALSGAFIGYGLLRLHCPDDATAHYLITHVGALVVYSAIAYALGRRILSW